MEVRTTDYHTAGEPFRIVTAGAPELDGATVRERRERAAASEAAETVRRLLCHEPRGHADMYGCFLVPPDDAGADLGVLFWHKDGYSTACGHGTIALGAWAVESGRVAAPADGVADVTLDVPSGRVVARVRRRAGQVEAVGFRNVPAFVIARAVPAAGVAVDVAYGGAIYAFAAADRFGLTVAPRDLPRLIEAGRAVKAALDGTPVTRHPEDERLSGLYGTVFHEPAGPGRAQRGDLRRRRGRPLPDGLGDLRPDRAAGRRRGARPGDAWVNESIVGTSFTARALQDTPAGLLTEVEGTAFRTGEHRFLLDPRDPLGTGFVLR